MILGLVPHLMDFCVHLRGRGLTTNSIRDKLAAITFASKASGLVEHIGDLWVIKMIEGWAREEGKSEDNRESLSPVVLSGLKGV